MTSTKKINTLSLQRILTFYLPLECLEKPQIDNHNIHSVEIYIVIAITKKPTRRPYVVTFQSNFRYDT